MGAPIVLLAKDLGANSITLGIIASFTPLMTMLQLPAARHLGKYSYRSFALMGWGLRSIFIAISALVPLLFFFPNDVSLKLLLVSLFFFNLLRGISSAAFLPWVTNLVSAPIRGRFISIDHTFINAGFLIAMLASALLMKGHMEPWKYSLVLWVSAISAGISLFYLRLIPDTKHEETSVRSSENVPLITMMRLAPFRNWILFSLLFVFVGGGLGVFSVEYLKVQAHFSPSLIYGLSAFTFLGPMLILQWMGVRVDRFGSIPFIRLSLLGFSIVLAFWFAMSAGVISPSWWLVLFLNILGGVAMACFQMANGHLWMAVVPAQGKNHYFAMSSVIISFGAGIAPLLWGVLLDSLGRLDVVEGPFHLRRHSIYFLGIFLICVAALITSKILIEPDRHRKGEGEVGNENDGEECVVVAPIAD
ncbi:MAG: MFS transporter [Verrucomicrobia bacterium]|nr:MFS transporter [Verrucomicrobiota bacterium]